MRVVDIVGRLVGKTEDRGAGTSEDAVVEGRSVGSSVGKEEGLQSGALDGGSDGDKDGSSDGAADGSALWKVVGEKVEVKLGDIVGMSEGGWMD